MIHEPIVLSNVGGSATDVKNMSKSVLNTKEKINRILAHHKGHSIKEMNRLTRNDHYIDAGESVRFGICDKVVDRI